MKNPVGLFVVVSSLAVTGAQAAQERVQAPSASLRVSVVDQTGAAIVGASVQISPATGAPAVVQSDARGQALVADLDTGRVQLRVDAAGFAQHESAFNLRRGNNARTV